MTLGPLDKAASLQELDASIENDPPLRCIGVMGYPDEITAALLQAAQRFAARLIRRHPFLSFDALECLVIGSDFRDVLAAYEIEGRAYCAQFMAAAETALAVALPTRAGVVAIIHPQVMQQMLSAEPAVQNNGIRIFMHELCHVHDLGLRRKWVLQRARPQQAPDPLFWRCNSLWAEYFANRYSHFNGVDLGDEWQGLELVLEHLPRLEPSFAAQQVATAFGGALGSLAAEGIELDDARPDLAARVRAGGLSAAWLEASAVTEQLTLSGECWQHEAGVLRLMTAARLITNACKYGRRALPP